MSFDMNSPNPYAASPSTPPTAPKKSNVLLWVLLAVGGTIAAICCGCGGITYFFYLTGVNQIATVVKPQLQNDPAVQEHIGNIEKCEVDMQGLFKEVQKNPQRHNGRNMAVKLKGDKGEGLVIGRLDQQGGGQARFGEGELVMPNGEFFPLAP